MGGGSESRATCPGPPRTILMPTGWPTCHMGQGPESRCQGRWTESRGPKGPRRTTGLIPVTRKPTSLGTPVTKAPEHLATPVHLPQAQNLRGTKKTQ